MRWQEASHPPAYRECTGVLLHRGYNPRNCSLGADGEPVARRHQEFHATSCMLPPMDVQDFAQVIGHGATLWFLGDSVTGQMSRSLVCTMRAGGFTIEEIETVKTMSCIIMTHPQSSRSARVCFKRQARAGAPAKLFESLLLINANAHTTDHQETLVLNFGLHTSRYLDIQHALERWERYRPPTGRKLRLVWRDTSPQHFPEKGGLFNRAVTLPCAPIDDMRAAFEPYKDVTRMLSKFPFVHRLPIWSLTASRFDAHNLQECTHWCLPGVPDVWVQLLYALLKAQKDQS